MVDNSAAIAYIRTLTQDPYPNPDYRTIYRELDIIDYFRRYAPAATLKAGYSPGSFVIAEDTESDRSVYCFTFSCYPGTGRLIYAEDKGLVSAYRDLMEDLQPLHIFHNYLHDQPIFTEELGIPIRDGQFYDTMVRAYNLCLGGGGDGDGEGMAGRGSVGLKPLAYRHLNMKMDSFKDTVFPCSIPKLTAYLDTARLLFEYEPRSVKRCQCGCLQVAHAIKGKRNLHHGPCSACGVCEKYRAVKHGALSETDDRLNRLYRKIGGLLNDISTGRCERDQDDEDDIVNPWKRIDGWHDYDRDNLVGNLGPVPRPSIKDVPESRLLRYACLHGDSLVQTNIGLRKIKDLVKYRYSGKVRTVKNGSIVYRPVTGWYRFNHEEPVKWMSVITDKTVTGRWGPKSTRYTPDHQLLTSKGLKRVDSLVPGDSLALPFERLDSNQLQITLGSLLGDGCISTRNKSGWSNLRISHSVAQKPWLDWKASVLGPLVSSRSIQPPCTKNEIDGRPLESQEHHYITTVMHPEFLDYRNLSYVNGKRVIGDWIDSLDSLGLAIAYLDNGTLAGSTPRIYMHRFDSESVDRFRRRLQDMGIASTRFSCRRDGKHKGWAIHVSSKSINRFYKSIVPWVHPSMQYKLGVPSRFCPKPPVSRGMYSSLVKSVVHNRVNRRGGIKTSYCIDVEETHNFLTEYEVAKNCRDADATLRLYHFLQTHQPWIFY